MTLKSADLKRLKPLHVATPYVDDPATLNKMWEEDGYLFFRDVLDKDAIAEVTQTYVKALVGLGVVDAGGTEPLWNGANTDNFPFKIEEIEKSKIWERFIRHPSVQAFAARIFQDEPHWLPMTEYRVTPPRPPEESDVLLFRHQDACQNAGIPFRVFWIPVSEADADTGGLVVAEGWHKRGLVHDPNDYPSYGILAETIPDEDWRRSDYHPGDVLVFNAMTPHSGTSNCSHTFRCSMDLRVMKASDPRPVIGEVFSVGPDSVTIRDKAGVITRLAATQDSIIRGGSRMKISSLAALQAELPVGMRVVVSHAEGAIICIRPER